MNNVAVSDPEAFNGEKNMLKKQYLVVYEGVHS